MQRRIGIVLAIVGIVIIAFTGYNLMTTEEVVNLGAIKINHEESHPVQWSPIMGAVLLGGGLIVIALDKKMA